MTSPDNLIEDILVNFANEVADADATIRNAAQQLSAWRRLAKTAADAFADVYAVCHEGGSKGMPADAMHPEDYKRMKNWKAEIASAQAAANQIEERQP